MKLRSITLDNVRRFTDPVTVGPIGDGVTLLCEPNEAGKSTLFDALHAVFFLKHGSAAGDVKALRPHSGGKVAVECELDFDGARWRIRKEWLTGASVKVWREGALIHQGDLAEDWITSLVAGDAGGPGGLLWVRQGRVSLQARSAPEAKAELEKRRDLLTVISGAMEQVTGGERMDRVRDRVARDLDRLQTATGRPKTGGRWADAQALVDKLTQDEAALAHTVETLRQNLDDRRRLSDELADLEIPEAVTKRAADVAAASEALRRAEGLAKELQAAETQAKLARLQADEAQKEASRIAGLWSELEGATAAHKTSMDDLAAKVETAQTAARAHETANKALAKAAADHAQAQATIQRIDRREAATKATVEREELATLIDRASQANSTRIKQAAIAAKGPKDALVSRIHALDRSVAEKRALRDAAAPKISASYAADAPQVRIGGRPLLADETRSLPEDGLVQMPGIGTLHIETKDKDLGAELARAEAELASALSADDWADPGAMDAAVTARDAAQNAAEKAKQFCDAIAPDGIDALRVRLAALGEDATHDIAPLPVRTEAEAALAAAARTLTEAQDGVAKLDASHRSTALIVARAEAGTDIARARAATAARAVDGLAKPDPKAAEASLTPLREAAQNAEALLAKRAAQTPDLDQLRARLARVMAVADANTKRAGDIRSQISKLTGVIETRGEEGVEEVLEDVRGRRQAAQTALDRVAFERDVSVRLLAALDAAQKAARDQYFAPIAAELRPLLADLWGDADLQWSDDTLLPVALVRRGTEESIDVLSGGTQEQIAFLVRLAFARLLAKSGRHAPLILDDALVYSDDDRIERMFDALHGAAPDLQIIVLSCRQRAFRDLGAPSLSFQPVEAS